MSNELLQQVRILDPLSQTDRVADVLIEAGKISAIADAISDYPADTQIHNAQGWVLGPGLVDLYSHSGEPGFEERETLLSLMQSAAAGGFTRLAILPDTVPAMDTPTTITWLQEKWQTNLQHIPNSKFPISNSLPSLYPWAALTQDIQGQKMTELAELAELEIAGFADGQPIANLLLIRRLLEYLRPLNRPIALWPCDPQLVGNGVMREGHDSIVFGLPGIPALAETTAIAAVLECVEEVGTPVHLMRLSTARSVELVRLAKQRGLPITASTTWMHLLLNTASIGSYNPSLRLNPPLGTAADQQALLQAVKDGVVDATAIDHTPYTYEEKTVAFAEAPPGAIGLQLALPLLWQTLVATGQWSALELWATLSTRPALCLCQAPPSITPGQAAEIVLFNPYQSWTANSQTLKSRSMNTPWLDQAITGQVIKLWCPSTSQGTG
ncbi:dihydroorotase [Leptodesmis sp.]|uniref:dihydroorotase n=1 Tax=Leptodesmis sp. TaxID=3100501 RepID=UPI0040535955